jgi:hypothetical protein
MDTTTTTIIIIIITPLIITPRGQRNHKNPHNSLSPY